MISCRSCKTIQTDVPKFRFTELGSNLANPLENNIHYVYNMQKEYVIQSYKTINKLLCNLSFAGQYTSFLIRPVQTFRIVSHDDLSSEIRSPSLIIISRDPYSVERDFMSKFRNTNGLTSSTSLTIPLDIFAINNPELAKHIPDTSIYPTKHQLHKANTFDK